MNEYVMNNEVSFVSFNNGIEEIEKNINENKDDYTVWFVIAFNYFYKNFKK